MLKPYAFLFVIFLLPVKGHCQNHEGLASILTTVLESRLIQPYLPHDSTDQLNIHYLIAGRNVPTRMEVIVNGKKIPVVIDPEGYSGNLLHVAKLIWKNQKAKVIVKGPGNIFARYKLSYVEDRWEVANAFLKGVALRDGKKNKSWDIKF